MHTINRNTKKKSDYTAHLQASPEFDSVILEPISTDKNFITGLSHFQKILMITDGTVTGLLEHHSGETIKVEKIYERIESNFDNIPSCHKALTNSTELPALVRRILLQGETTQKNYIYASSSILINNLPNDFRKDLLSSQMPIGKLWSKHRLETYKTDFTAKQERASEAMATYLNVEIGSSILTRTYSVYSNGKKTMIITEKFSSDSFLD